MGLFLFCLLKVLSRPPSCNLASMATLIDLIRPKVKDDSGRITDPDDLISAATEALNRYSKDRPLEVVVDIPGSASHDCDLPTDWVDGFSAILQVEYPVDRVPAVTVDRADYSIYTSPAGKKLRILIAAPAADEVVRQTYTLPHSEDSLPSVDLEAVANLAASVCLRQLAASFGQTSDPLIQADSVNYRSKSDEFRRLADSFEALYKSHLGIKANDTVTAGLVTAPPPERTRGFRR